MRSLMQHLLSISLIALATKSALSGEPTQHMYLVDASILEGNPKGSMRDGSIRALAAPRLAVTERKEADFFVGALVGIKQLRSGTSLNLVAQEADNGKIKLSGMLEFASVGPPVNGLQARESTTIHFDTVVRPGQKSRIMLPGKGNAQQWFELVVNRAPEKPPAANRPNAAAATDAKATTVGAG